LRRRSTKTQTGAVGEECQPVAHNDTREPLTRKASEIMSRRRWAVHQYSRASAEHRGVSPPAPPSLPHPSAHIRLTMLRMDLPVLAILIRQCLVPDDQHILRVLFLGGLGEIERPGDDELLIYDHDLVVGDGMLRVNHGWHPLVGQEVSRGVFFAALALVENDLDSHATSVRIEQRLGDGAEVKL
jgi:hypothetical protein